MRPKVPTIPSLSELSLPAKDIVRGAQAALRKASQVLEPVEEKLPTPLKQRGLPSKAAQHFAQSVFQMAFDLGRLLRPETAGAGQHIDLDLDVDDHDRGPASALFARAAAHGLEFSFHRLDSDRFLVSRTLAAAAYHAALAQGPLPPEPAARAAKLCALLLSFRVAARAPGTTLRMTEDDHQLVHLAAFATTLWLLVERDAPQTNEDEILTLCVDVASSLRGEITAAGDDEAVLARLLDSYAAVI